MVLNAASESESFPSASRTEQEKTMSTQAGFGHSHKMGFANRPTEAAGSVSSTRLRSNLLHKLGIHGVDKTPPPQIQPPRSLLEGAAVTSEPLKYEDDEEESDDEERQDGPWGKPWIMFRPASQENRGEPPLSSSVSSTASSSASSQQEPRIKFNDNVTVVPIPQRDDYSRRVKERLWTNVQDIQLNAQRNALEFAAEGWDWRTVAEDDEMYRCADSGEKIHPVHLEQQG